MPAGLAAVAAPPAVAAVVAGGVGNTLGVDPAEDLGAGTADSCGDSLPGVVRAGALGDDPAVRSGAAALATGGDSAPGPVAEGGVEDSVAASWGGVAVLFAVGAVGLIGGGSEEVEFPLGFERDSAVCGGPVAGELVINPLM